MTGELTDRLAIRDLVESWAVWRDASDWERFRGCWRDDGWMMATWFQGPSEDLIHVSHEGFEKGVNILHFLGDMPGRKGPAAEALYARGAAWLSGEAPPAPKVG